MRSPLPLVRPHFTKLRVPQADSFNAPEKGGDSKCTRAPLGLAAVEVISIPDWEMFLVNPLSPPSGSCVVRVTETVMLYRGAGLFTGGRYVGPASQEGRKKRAEPTNLGRPPQGG